MMNSTDLWGSAEAKPQQPLFSFGNGGINRFGSTFANLQVVDMLGRVVHTQTLDGTRDIIDYTFINGLYFISVEMDGVLINRKILVSR